jgi:hypothetical protein
VHAGNDSRGRSAGPCRPGLRRVEKAAIMVDRVALGTGLRRSLGSDPLLLRRPSVWAGGPTPSREDPDAPAPPVAAGILQSCCARDASSPADWQLV